MVLRLIRRITNLYFTLMLALPVILAVIKAIKGIKHEKKQPEEVQ